MRFRLGVIALATGILATVVSWLTVQPTIALLLELLNQSAYAYDETIDRVRTLLPTLIGLDIVLATGSIFLVLYISLGSPLRRAEETIDRIAQMDTELPLTMSGPLTARLDHALRRLSSELQDERSKNKKQLADLQEANEKLRRVQAELVASDRLATVGKLAAGVAHEVGNPLAGVLGYLSVVRMRGKNDEELTDLVQRIEHEVQRIDQIVRSLLELGRPSRGKPSPIDISVVVTSCVRLLSAGTDFANVKIDVVCPDNTFMRAESGPLSQVIVNLLLNAAQAMNGVGTICIRVAIDGSSGSIVVDDSGPGIPADVMPRLFEPFFTTKQAGKGTGLGLAVSAHLLAQFGGSLSAENRAEGGARFIIRMPAS